MPYWRRYNEIDLIGDVAQLVIDGAKFISRNVDPSAIKKGFKSLKKKLTPKRFQKKEVHEVQKPEEKEEKKEKAEVMKMFKQQHNFGIFNRYQLKEGMVIDPYDFILIRNQTQEPINLFIYFNKESALTTSITENNSYKIINKQQYESENNRNILQKFLKDNIVIVDGLQISITNTQYLYIKNENPLYIYYSDQKKTGGYYKKYLKYKNKYLILKKQKIKKNLLYKS